MVANTHWISNKSLLPLYWAGSATTSATVSASTVLTASIDTSADHLRRWRIFRASLTGTSRRLRVSSRGTMSPIISKFMTYSGSRRQRRPTLVCSAGSKATRDLTRVNQPRCSILTRWVKWATTTRSSPSTSRVWRVLRRVGTPTRISQRVSDWSVVCVLFENTPHLMNFLHDSCIFDGQLRRHSSRFQQL